ncbi:cupin domain-containing protein [Nonomuraea sp. NPDC003707]
MNVLADLVAPHDAEEFLGVVWGRTMAHFPGEPGRFGQLLHWDHLNEILAHHCLAPPRLRLARAGQLIPEEEYGLPPDAGRPQFRIRHQHLAKLLRGGATLVMDAIDELHAPIQQMAADLERTLHERVQVNCYASFGPQPGFHTHWDDHEVLVLQVHGRKRWRIFGPTRPHPTRRDEERPPEPEGAPHADLILNDGDVLHVPRGWWHDATAIDGPSLHLTFGVSPATGADLLAWAIDRLRRHVLVRQNLPAHDDIDAQHQHVKALLDLLVSDLSPLALEAFRTSRDTQAPARSHPSLPWAAMDAELPDDVDFRLRLLTPRARLDGHGDTVRLIADGQIHTFAGPARPILRRLIDGTTHSLSELTVLPGNKLSPQTVRTLCTTLVRLGLAAVGPPTG